MQTLEIQIPEGKTRIVKALLKELGVDIKIKKNNKTPNAETIKAMDELKTGGGRHFLSVDELFEEI